jgi:TPR repeat protein/sugar lactone lactonase YvrE
MTSAFRPHLTKLWGLAFLFISVSLHAASPKEALLIANGKYSHFAGLAHPPSDAEKLQAALEQLGFRVRVVRDGNREQMLDAIGDFERGLRNTGAVAFFHYGGHGVQVDGKNYLLPADADIPDERRVATRAVALDEVMTAMDAASARASIIVIDACRDNPLPAGVGRNLARGLSVVGMKPKNSIVIYAAEAGSKAQDGLFTPILAMALQKKGKTIDQVMKSVRSEVYAKSNGQQTPGEYNQLFEELFLGEEPKENSNSQVIISPAPRPNISSTDETNSTVAIIKNNIAVNSTFTIIKDNNTERERLEKTNKKKKLTFPKGQVSVVTMAGWDQGFKDGLGSEALFNRPAAVAADLLGNVYVADNGNHRIRKIMQSGNVTTLAGSGKCGFANGQGAKAQFDMPTGVAVDAYANVYVADTGNHQIRKITQSGNVTTLAGSGKYGYADGAAASASFRTPVGVAVDNQGNVYVADSENNRIRKINPAGDVFTLAGSGKRGNSDGHGELASFYFPAGVAVDSKGNVFVADTGNHLIRKISPSGSVKTLAGSGYHDTSGNGGFADGKGIKAVFSMPKSVSVDKYNNLYVADEQNNMIRIISANGDVTTLAGNGLYGHSEDSAEDSKFASPSGVSVDSEGNVYVADIGNHAIRKIEISKVPTAPHSAPDAIVTAKSSSNPNPAILPEGEGKETISDLKIRAEQGDAEAQKKLGNSYFYGESVQKDIVEAVKWWRKAAEQGYADAQFNLGSLYSKGEDVPKDTVEAIKWYRKAAEQGDAKAQLILGISYELGEDVPKDMAEAVKWYRKAAEQGITQAQLILGTRYSKGEDVPKDMMEGVKWWRKAAEQGYADAQFNLGFAYSEGEGVPKNAAEALKWYRLAAEQGDAAAQYNLANSYYNGEGVPQNPVEAVKWYRKAAEQGITQAQYNLGCIYKSGIDFTKDMVEAYAFFNLASIKNKQALESRDLLAKQMTSEQIAAAQMRTKELQKELGGK